MFKIDNLMESLTGYFEAKVELIKLDVKQEGAKLIATAAVFMIAALIVLLALITLTIGLGALLNKAFDSNYLGYIVIAVVYLIIAGIMIAMKDSISGGITKSILSSEGKPKTDRDYNHTNKE
jgi:uncharacterized membrane protein YqjE